MLSVSFTCTVPCEQLAIVAGGYSALLLLPGRDHPSRGSMAMLEGGTWCSRDATHAQGSLQIEVNATLFPLNT